jgi:hypothetical protein
MTQAQKKKKKREIVGCVPVWPGNNEGIIIGVLDNCHFLILSAVWEGAKDHAALG